MSSYRIGALPAPSPLHLLPNGARPARPYPFVDASTRYFHLARGAVHRAIRELGLGGADVLVPAWHHGVEVDAIVAAGARPVFYGLTPELSADLGSLAEAITPATRALYVIHYLGLPQPMRDLSAFARGHGLKVIEDCALALLSRDEAMPLGARGDAAIFCLYKTLGVPDGGALRIARTTTPPLELDRPTTAAMMQELAAGLLARWSTRSALGNAVRRGASRVARSLRTRTSLPADARPVGHARFVPGEERMAISPITKRLLDSVDARDIVERRRRNFLDLHDRLGRLATPLVRELPEGVCPLFYPLLVEDKRLLQAALQADRIESVDFWRDGSPLPGAGRFPLVEELRERVLELPIHQDVDEDDVARIARVVRRELTGPVRGLGQAASSRTG